LKTKASIINSHNALLGAVLIILLSGFPIIALANPSEKMFKIVEHHIDVPADSFAAKPITHYRVGSKYGRTEEGDDSLNRIHQVIIVNEPNVWMINYYESKVAHHLVDHGPTFNFEDNIASPEDQDLQSFEFGRELEFFKKHGGVKTGIIEIDGKKYDRYELTVGLYVVLLYSYMNEERPFQIEIKKSGKLELAIRYDSFENNLEFQPDLFKPPEGYEIQEELKEVR